MNELKKELKELHKKLISLSESDDDKDRALEIVDSLNTAIIDVFNTQNNWSIKDINEIVYMDNDIVIGEIEKDGHKFEALINDIRDVQFSIVKTFEELQAQDSKLDL